MARTELGKDGSSLTRESQFRWVDERWTVTKNAIWTLRLDSLVDNLLVDFVGNPLISSKIDDAVCQECFYVADTSGLKGGLHRPRPPIESDVEMRRVVRLECTR